VGRLLAGARHGLLLVFNAVQASRLVPRPLRYVLLRAFGIGTATHLISHGCWFGGRDVQVGQGTFVNFGCVFDNLAAVRIGARCDIGMEAMFVTSTHEPGAPERRAGAVGGKPVTVGDGCWIGARVMVMPGVSVGDGCVLAAGAIVTRDCEPHGLYAGVPAQRVRDLGT
jgi:acetyltransferase-like isoleucine patch superfamily enzyme